MVLGFIFLIIGAILNNIDKGITTSIKNRKEEAILSKDAIQIDTSSLSKLFISSPARAEKLYQGKHVRLNGVISRISTKAFDYDAEAEYGASKIKCIEPTSSDELIKISLGDEVYISGILKDVYTYRQTAEIKL